MPIVMTPVEVATITGATVAQLAIDTAADMIKDRTGHTPDDNVLDRGRTVGQVTTAWAIVATRLDTQTRTAATGTPLSESEANYSYSIDRNDALKAADLFGGLVADLLGLSVSGWSHVHSRDIPDHPFWSDIDQQADGWLDARAPTVMSGRYPVR
jgi:hypothetical protein